MHILDCGLVPERRPSLLWRLMDDRSVQQPGRVATNRRSSCRTSEAHGCAYHLDLEPRTIAEKHH